MKIENQDISTNDYLQPATSFAKRWAKRILKWLGISLVAVVVVLFAWRFGRNVYLNSISDPLVRIDVGTGGFNRPYSEIYWKNGVVTTENEDVAFFLISLLDVRWPKATQIKVQALADAIEQVDPTHLTESEIFEGFDCIVLDAPTVTYTSLMTGKSFTVPGNKSGCYKEQQEINELLYSPK